MTTITKIDKNIPLPSLHKYTEKYPWADMKPGDSFFIEMGTPANIGACMSARKKYGERYVSRTVTENGVKGVRVWRIE